MTTLVRLAPALALFSCAAPKAIVIEEAPAPKKDGTEEPAVVEVPDQLPKDDGIRLPDMLAMPGDGEFRPTRPPATGGISESGAVIARPPTDPPSRPKPTE